MVRPIVEKVIPKENNKLEIFFNNGEHKEFDVTPYIKGGWYGKLKDKNYFDKVSIDGYTVVWPDGQDLCPDEIYYKSQDV